MWSLFVNVIQNMSGEYICLTNIDFCISYPSVFFQCYGSIVVSVVHVKQDCQRKKWLLNINEVYREGEFPLHMRCWAKGHRHFKSTDTWFSNCPDHHKHNYSISRIKRDILIFLFILFINKLDGPWALQKIIMKLFVKNWITHINRYYEFHSLTIRQILDTPQCLYFKREKNTINLVHTAIKTPSTSFIQQ